MKLRYLSLVAVLALVAACESPKNNAGNQGAQATTNQPAQTETAQPAGPAPGSQADFVANVGDRIFFDFDKSNLRPDAVTTLAKWVAFLKQYPNDKILIQGNCDERGTREYNLALGERRANSAKNYLVAQGIDAGRLKTISYGKERPVAQGHDEAAWSQNRNDIGVIQ